MARVLTPRRIADLMTDRIRAYFCSLGHEPAEAEDLHTHYYKAVSYTHLRAHET